MKIIESLIILVSCGVPVLGGCGETVVGGGTGGDGGATTSASSTSSGSTSADHCAGALHVPVGGSVSGSTCTGTFVDGENLCQEPAHPGVFVYVDAPSGTGVQVEATAGYSLMAYSHCDSTLSLQCNFGGGTPFAPTDMSVRLFQVSRVDAECGDFTVTATTH